MLVLNIPVNGSGWIRIQHAGEECWVSARYHPQPSPRLSQIAVAFDGPRTFVIARENMIQRGEEVRHMGNGGTPTNGAPGDKPPEDPQAPADAPAEAPAEQPAEEAGATETPAEAPPGE